MLGDQGVGTADGRQRSCPIPGDRQMHIPPWPWFSIRRVGDPVEKGKVMSSIGTPLVGETVSVFSHTREIIGADGVSSRNIEAKVDTGASFLAVPETLLRELGIVAE